MADGSIDPMFGENEMAQYRKKPVVIEATQWYKDGDHPNVVEIPAKVLDTIEARTDAVGINDCRWIGTLEGGHIVSPGDWIITGVQGELYPVKCDIFYATYDKVDEDNGHRRGRSVRVDANVRLI